MFCDELYGSFAASVLPNGLSKLMYLRSMDNKGLLFIPDISGFSKFVTEMEIEHSRHVIQELLEVLIDANQLGLEISEIEGDAILFYKHGDAPQIKDLYQQVKAMFCAFHAHLRAYESRRFCQCKACNTAINLTLKVITHYGEFTGYRVKNFSKLIGKDVIVAHQLLKNDIDDHEYWLITDNVIGDGTSLNITDWMNWDVKSKATEGGEVVFHYTQLTALKNDVELPQSEALDLSDKACVVSASREYETDIKRLFYTAVHFEFRKRWLEGVKEIDEVSEFLPGVGTRHRCVLDNGQMMKFTSSFNYDPARRIDFSETDEKKRGTINFILENIGLNRTRLTLEYLVSRDWIAIAKFRLLKQAKVQQQFDKSLTKLQVLVNEIVPEVEF